MATDGDLEESISRPRKRLNRRQFLKVGAGLTAAAAVAGCTTPPPPPTTVPSPVPAPPTTAPTAAATPAPPAPAATAVPAASPTAVAGPAQPLTAQRLIDKPIPENFFIPLGSNAETRLDMLPIQDQVITPNSQFFVRNHVASVVVDAKKWQLSVEGSGVNNPYKLTYDELLAMPSTTVTRYVECSGNGRSFYQSLLNKPAQGGQWHLGAWGVASWTGVKLSDLVNRAGLKSTATELMPIGLDQPNVRRPMPVDKAMQPDSILAYRMNGEILPIDAGFPARVVAPGLVGISNIKWVGTIKVTEEHNAVEWNTNLYVLIGPDFPPPAGAKGPPLTTQVLKSAVALPWPAALKAGQQTVRGYAWSPNGKVNKVEVSIDDGKTWSPAKLIEPNLEFAGVRWEFSFDAKPGDMTITPRATDDKGTQPDLSQQKWNEQGYIFAAPVPHPVKVS